MELEAIQQALRERKLSGWLFCDFHHRDPIAYRILGLPMGSMTTRRWFYYVPAAGVPRKLAHVVEPRKLDALPGEAHLYLSWRELHEKLREILGRPGTIAMQYSPMNHLPTVSLVDAGTVELVRSFGHEVVSSAELVQLFEAVFGEEDFRSHVEAGEKIQRIKDDAFALMDRALRKARPVTENDVKDFILARFEEEGLTSDGDSPIVGFNDHPVDPHFEPTPDNAYTLHHGDTILVDLWARRREPPGVYYDITWCGFAGQQPPPLYQEIFRVVCEARDAALDFVRRRLEKGEVVRGCDVDDVSRDVVRRAGFGDHFLHRTGHNIGLTVHGNGVNLDNLETRDDRPIVPGVCFSIEPGIYLPGQMAARSEINVFVTPDGRAEVVGPMQRELLMIG